jgi:hypothetical protein
MLSVPAGNREGQSKSIAWEPRPYPPCDFARTSGPEKTVRGGLYQVSAVPRTLNFPLLSHQRGEAAEDAERGLPLCLDATRYTLA